MEASWLLCFLLSEPALSAGTPEKRKAQSIIYAGRRDVLNEKRALSLLFFEEQHMMACRVAIYGIRCEVHCHKTLGTGRKSILGLPDYVHSLKQITLELFLCD